MDVARREFETPQKKGLNVPKFMTWLFIATIIMLFGAITSAYIVKRAEGHWNQYELPNLFIYSTIAIVLSSGSMHMAVQYLKRDKFQSFVSALLVTFVLGIIFLLNQFFAWGELFDNQVYFGGQYSNAAGSFIYVISGLHWVHIISGLTYLLVVMIKALRYKITKSNMKIVQSCALFWHFLGFLWIYLYIFLIIFR